MRKIFLFLFLFLFATNSHAVTRLYFSNASSDGTFSATSPVCGGWNEGGAPGVNGALGVKAGVATTVTSSSTSSVGDYFLGRWQTTALTNPISFNTGDTVQYVAGVLASSTTNTTSNFHIVVCVLSDTTTDRGDLLIANGTGTAWTTTSTGRTDGLVNLTGNVVAQKGDRILVIVGWHRTGSSSSARTTTMDYGNTGATDLTSGSTSTTTQPGWIEFSKDFNVTSTISNNSTIRNNTTLQ